MNKTLRNARIKGYHSKTAFYRVLPNRNERRLKFTQPVLIKSLHDEFDLPDEKYYTPADPGQVLSPSKEGDILNPKIQTMYRSGVGKLIHLM